MSAEHTQTPWEVAGKDHAGCSTIVSRLSPGASFEVASHLVRRDAEFIVRAVNSYEALLKLVKRHREWIQRNEDENTIEDFDWSREADKVIAQAEARP